MFPSSRWASSHGGSFLWNKSSSCPFPFNHPAPGAKKKKKPSQNLLKLLMEELAKELNQSEISLSVHVSLQDFNPNQYSGLCFFKQKFKFSAPQSIREERGHEESKVLRYHIRKLMWKPYSVQGFTASQVFLSMKDACNILSKFTPKNPPKQHKVLNTKRKS